jgi:colicin import membrane protein
VCQARCREAEEQLQRRSEVPPSPAPAAEEGGPELERRRQELDHYAQHLRQERRQLDEEAQRLAEESARLQREEEQRKRQVQAERPAPVPSSVGRSQSLPAVKNLRAELKVLRQEIENRDVALHEMRRQLQEAQEAAEREVPPSLEAELVRMHLQIERERKELDEQIRQMQLRQTELEEAAREAELQLSRERAQMARDQAELKRVKDELRLEKERLQRGEGLREKLGPVQRLKEKLLQKDPPGDATPKPAGNVGNGPRFRARRGLLGDKPA